MESPAFPHIVEIKLMNLKLYKLMNIFMSPKIMQKRSKLYVFAVETSRKVPLPFFIAANREMHQSKKCQHKNLVQAKYSK